MTVIVVSKRAVDAARAEVAAFRARGLEPDPEIVELANAKPRRRDESNLTGYLWNDMSLAERRAWVRANGHSMTDSGDLRLHVPDMKSIDERSSRRG